MFTNYLKVALRNLARHKLFAFINIFGLSLGIACGVIIMLYVQSELSFDESFTKKDNLYRVLT
ncbi:MAG TPA: ABC transporter permease, partial [Bacteroidota bacterium]